MKIIDFFKRHRFLKHLLFVLVVACLLVFGLFWWLDVYTRHGESEVVPDLQGLSLSEATSALTSHQLSLSVYDSVYSRTAKPGTVVEQNPKPGELVKHGRKIYVSINSINRPLVVVPDLEDLSLRQARVAVEGAELVVADVVYCASKYKDLVLSAESNGRKIGHGDRLPVGSPVRLNVGAGTTDNEEVYYMNHPELRDQLGDEIESKINF